MLITQWRKFRDRGSSLNEREKAYEYIYNHLLEEKYDKWKIYFKGWLFNFPEIEFDDIFNPVLTKLWVKSISSNVDPLPEYRKEDGIYSYIFTALIRRLSNFERTRRGVVLDPYDDIIETFGTVSNSLRDIEDYELVNVLEEAFKNSNSFCAKLLTRFYVEGYKYSEMKSIFRADYDEVTLDNLRQRKVTCINNLRNFMGIKLKQLKKN